MNKIQLKRHLTLLHKDLQKCASRMNKIADKLNIEQHEGVASALNDVKELLDMMEKENVDQEV